MTKHIRMKAATVWQAIATLSDTFKNSSIETIFIPTEVQRMISKNVPWMKFKALWKRPKGAEI